MLNALSDWLRLARAGAEMARHDVILPEPIRRRAPGPVRAVGWILRLSPGHGLARGRPAEKLARALERLGPAWIKLGQFLATRPDVIGVSAAEDLSRLKDQLPPFSQAAAVRALRDEFGEEADRLFAGLSAPVAAASVAQVHRLERPDGAWAVKILRPGVENTIERELSAMRRAARAAEASRDAEILRMRPVAFVETLSLSLQRELDLRFEGGAASEFAEIAARDGYVRVPEVDWTRTGRRVLTTRWIEGRPLTDPLALDGADRVELANRVTRGFLATALDHGFFHADLHEGNMILSPRGELFLVDFGIMGRIGPDERLFLAQILKGFLERDYRRVAEVHFEAGYVPEDRSVEEFAQALRSVGEPIFGKDASDVAMARVLLQLFDITRAFGMRLRPELVLLQKTMVQVEGVARALDPAHNIWRAAEPVVTRWTGREFGPEGVGRLIARLAKDASLRLRRLPETLDRLEEALKASAAQNPAPAARMSFSSLLLAGVVGGVIALVAAFLALNAALMLAQP